MSNEVVSNDIQPRAKRKVRILFITCARTEGPINTNHHQRIRTLGADAELTILAPYGSRFILAPRYGAKVMKAAFPSRLGQLTQALGIIGMGGGKYQFDIVLTDPTLLGACGVIIKAMGARIKWIVDLWDIPFRRSSNRLLERFFGGMVRRIMRWAYSFADQFLVSIVPDLELSWFGIPENRIKLFNNAIWPAERQACDAKNAEGEEILCMRSVHGPDMGLDTLAQAFLLLERKFPALRLTIIGNVPGVSEDQIRSILPHPRVKLIGFIGHDEMMERISRATVCVIPFKNVPDLAQTYPIKVLEFLSNGKPVVASNITGIARMIRDRRNGLLFQAGDPVDLADKLAELIRAPELRQQLSREASRLGPEHNAYEKGRQILAVLEQLSGGDPVVCEGERDAL